MATRDKLIFPSAITRLLRHFEVCFPFSDPFPVMGAIDASTIKCSEAQFHSRQSESTATSTPSVLSTSTPSTSTRGVTLNVIMAQLQCMDACLDTLSTELYQVNTRVSYIARRQARLGGFVESPSLPPKAFETSEDDDDSNDDDDDNEYGDDSSPSDNEMSTWHSYPLSLMTKRGSSFGYESSHG